MTYSEVNNRAVAVSEARRYLTREGVGAPGAVELIDMLNAFFPEWRRLEYTGADADSPLQPVAVPERGGIVGPAKLPAAEMGHHAPDTGE